MFFVFMMSLLIGVGDIFGLIVHWGFVVGFVGGFEGFEGDFGDEVVFAGGVVESDVVLDEELEELGFVVLV
jgi:hypothetical protein